MSTFSLAISYSNSPKTDTMFGLFKKKSKREQLMEKYNKLTQEAYELSHRDRKASDLKTAEAQEVLKEMEQLEEE